MEEFLGFQYILRWKWRLFNKFSSFKNCKPIRLVFTTSTKKKKKKKKKEKKKNSQNDKVDL